MKKILLYTLFLSFMSVLQAQITPTSTGTSTADDGGVTVIGIAAPDDSGFSNNTYSDFNISSNGIILNNSGSTSTSLLTGGDVNANANITAGNEASLILNQVEGNTRSSLAGMLEVVGTNAAVIIANPNGISCNGCGFINVNRIDLIAGTRQSDGSFSMFDSTIDITGGGLDASESELNLVSRFHQIDASIDAGINLRILSGDDSYNYNNFTLTSIPTIDIWIGRGYDPRTGERIDVTNFAIEVSSDASLQADSIEIIGTAIDFGINIGAGVDLSSSLGDIKLQVNGSRIYSSGDINSARDFFVIIDYAANYVEDFINTGNIVANDFNAIVTDFENINNATISVDNFNVTTVEYFRNLNGSVIKANNFNVSASGPYYFNGLNGGEVRVSFISNSSGFRNESDSTIDANNITISLSNNTKIVENYFSNEGGNIITDTLTLVVENNSSGEFDITPDDFNIYSSADFDDFLVTDGTLEINHLNFVVLNGNFINDAGIELTGNLGITANNFINTAQTVSADVFNLSITGDFDYIADYLNNGTINVAALNLRVEGDFSYDDTTGFVWQATDSLTVLGSAFVTTDSFTNNGVIDIANSLTISTATEFFLNTDDTLGDGNITADTLNLFLVGYFDYSSDYLNNGNIDATNLNITISDDNFFNNVNIELAGNLGITAIDFSNDGAIDVGNSFTVTVTGDFINNAAIDVGNNFTVTATGDFINNTAIDVNNDFNVTTATGDFINNAAIDVGNSFNVTTATGDFINNAAIDVANNFNVTTATGDFINNTAIDVANNFNVITGLFDNNAAINTYNFSVTAIDFSNDEALSIAKRLSVIAENFTNNAAIDADSFATLISGDFQNSTAATIRVLRAGLFGNNFNNSGDINSPDLFFADVSGNFINSGKLESSYFVVEADHFSNESNGDIVSDTAAAITANSFNNNSNIQANNLVIVTTANNSSNPNNGDFNNNGNIYSQLLAVVAERDFYNNQEIIATTNAIIQANSLYNYGLGVIQSDYLDISTDSLNNGGDIHAYVMKLISNNYDNSGDVQFQYLFR